MVKTFLFGILAIPFTPLCQCLSDETVKAVGPFYLVSIGPATRNDIVDDGSSTMVFNVAKIASARASLTKSLRVAGP